MADKYSTNNCKDELGRFLPGNPGKPKGSSKNKLRDQIRTFLNDNWDSLPDWFEKLKPKEKFDVIISLMPYAVSRLQSVHMGDQDGNDLRPPYDYTKLSEQALKELLSIVQDEG